MNLRNPLRSIILGAMLGATLYGSDALAAGKKPCIDTSKPCATVTKKITSPVPKLGSFRILKHVGGKDLESALRIHEGKNTVDMHSTNEQGKSLYQALCAGDYVKVTGLTGSNVDLGGGYRIRTWIPSSPRNRPDQLAMVDKEGKITYERLSKSKDKAVNLIINKALYRNDKMCASAAANVIVSISPDCNKLEVVASTPDYAKTETKTEKKTETQTTETKTKVTTQTKKVPDAQKPAAEYQIPVPSMDGKPAHTKPGASASSGSAVTGTPAAAYSELQAGVAIGRNQLTGTDAKGKELPALDFSFKGIDARYKHFGDKNMWNIYALHMTGDDAVASQPGVPQGSYNTAVSTKETVTTLGVRLDHTFSKTKVNPVIRGALEYKAWSMWNYFDGQTSDQSNITGEAAIGLKVGDFTKSYGTAGVSVVAQQVMDKQQSWNGNPYTAETSMEFTPNIFADFRVSLYDTDKTKVYLEGEGRISMHDLFGLNINNKTLYASGADRLEKQSAFWNVALGLGVTTERSDKWWLPNGGYLRLNVANNVDPFKNLTTGQTIKTENNGWRLGAGLVYSFK